MSAHISQPLPNVRAISSTTQFFLLFLALFIYFANMVTPDILEQTLLAALLGASISTQLLVCKSNAERKNRFYMCGYHHNSIKTYVIKNCSVKMRTADLYNHSFLVRRSMGGAVREGLTDGFNNKEQLTDVVKVCERSASPEPEDHVSLTKLLLNPLNFILFSSQLDLYKTNKEL